MMKHFSPENYETVIFDLGEVIIDLNGEAVSERLRSASGKDLDYQELIVSSPLMLQYETGKISEGQFRSGMMELLDVSFSDREFDDIWNLMLGDIPKRRLALMEELKEQYQVLILSNTNPIHVRKFDEIVSEQMAGKKMSDLVHRAHYSHVLGCRKPDADIYQSVIDEHQLTWGKALFLDARLDNVEAARQAGIHAVRVEYPDQIFEILGHG